jgi:hypothetical protein
MLKLVYVLRTQKQNFVPALSIFTDINRTGLAFQKKKTVIYRILGFHIGTMKNTNVQKMFFQKISPVD